MLKPLRNFYTTYDDALSFLKEKISKTVYHCKCVEKQRIDRNKNSQYHQRVIMKYREVKKLLNDAGFAPLRQFKHLQNLKC
jgi:hypothetical protein